VPITRLLQSTAFTPDEIAILSGAFEAALVELRLMDRSDPAVELVAKRIIEVAARGERDPIRLREAGISGS
jgi:hypothetical protein